MAELSRWLLELTGMRAIALSPKAGAHGELCGMIAIKAALQARGERRSVVLAPESAHGTNPATAALLGYRVVSVPARADELLEFYRTIGARRAKLGSVHAGIPKKPANTPRPARAFWSVTMYDGKSQLLIKNPLNRYLINSPMVPAMKKNDDGSLMILIQKDSPGADKEANWLPAPDGPIYMVMRLYWPETKAPSILPPGEGTWNPPGIVRMK